MNYASIKNCDIANGVGVRVSLFVSGCTHHCKGCFNREAWDFKYGKKFTQKEIDQILELLKPDYICGLSLLGGEPLELVNQKGLLPLVKQVKEKYPTKSIWCYSGYLFDQEIRDQMMLEHEVTRELIKYIDVLVDGKFELTKKDPTLRFRGSSNQRIISVQESLRENKVVLWEGIEETC